MSLKQKAFSGMVWKFVEQASVSGIGFIINVVLMRLLTKADFGIIAMLSIFIALSQTLIDSGFASALIQKKNRTETDYNTVFIFNIFISIVCYLTLFFCAPLIADFYKTPLLTKLLRVLGLSLIIGSFNSIQRTQLIIKIDFKTTARVSLIGLIFGGIAGIIMAYTGFGVWSLVGQNIANAIFSSIVLWVSSKWRPSLIFSFTSLKGLFRFGSKLLIAAINSTIINNLYNIIIGKVYDPEKVGIYTNANKYPDLISSTLNSVLNSVTYPLLSSINDEKERMISVYARMLSMTAFVIFPVMTLLAVLSHAFVEVLLTEKWIAIVPLMQWFCFARMMTPISALNLSILNANGRSDLFLWTDLSKVPLVILNLAITIPLGIKYVAIGGMITTFISYFFNAFFPGKLFGYGAVKQIRDCSKTLLAILLMAAVTIPFLFLIRNQYLMLITGGLIGISSYLLIAYLLKIKELDELKLIITDIIHKRNE